MQLIFPLPGQTTPVGQGKLQLTWEPGKDHVLGGQKRRVEYVGQYYPGSHVVQFVAPGKVEVPATGHWIAYPTPVQ